MRFHSLFLARPRYRISKLQHFHKTAFNMEVSTTHQEDNTPSNSSYTFIKEGKSSIAVPNMRSVFYNPVQQFNRDLSIAVIREYVKERGEITAFVRSDSNSDQKIEAMTTDPQAVEEMNLTENAMSLDSDSANRKCVQDKTVNNSQSLKTQDSVEQGITVLEAMAASGLRSIRYAKEIPGIKNVTANDLSATAIEAMIHNIKQNDVDALVTPSHSDAVLLMHQHKHYSKQFDVVDLDPYGSPTRFLDAAVQCVKDGGLLLVTCTDVAILCGNESETCYAKYGSMSLKSKNCHEMALRIVLQCIESHANRYGRYIVPLISISVDFYVRLFVRIYTSPAIVKHSASKMAMVYQCVGCETMTLQPLGKVKPHENGRNFRFSCANGPPVCANCNHCGFKHKIGGPIWSQSIHDVNFVEKVLQSVESTADDFATSKRMIGILHLIGEELPDVPLFYALDRLHSIVHLPHCGILNFRSAILNAGFRVSESHTCKNSVKTDAPAQVIWDIIRTWAKEVSVAKKRLDDQTPGKAILDQEPQTPISFDHHSSANPESREKKLVRYQMNPLPFWGPKARATTNLLVDSDQEKSKLHQGKRQKLNSYGGDKKMRNYQCKRFKQGKCEFGDSCKYSHAEDNEKAAND